MNLSAFRCPSISSDSTSSQYPFVGTLESPAALRVTDAENASRCIGLSQAYLTEVVQGTTP